MPPRVVAHAHPLLINVRGYDKALAHEMVQVCRL